MKGMIKVWNLESKKEVFSYFLPGEDDPVEEHGDEDEQDKEDLTVNIFILTSLYSVMEGFV